MEDERRERGSRHMSPAEFAQALEVLGLTPRAFARILGTDDKHIREAIKLEGRGPSPAIAFAIRSLLRNWIPGPSVGSKNVLAAHIRKRQMAIVEDARRAGWPDQEIDAAMDWRFGCSPLSGED